MPAQEGGLLRVPLAGLLEVSGERDEARAMRGQGSTDGWGEWEVGIAGGAVGTSSGRAGAPALSGGWGDEAAAGHDSVASDWQGAGGPAHGQEGAAHGSGGHGQAPCAVFQVPLCVPDRRVVVQVSGTPLDLHLGTVRPASTKASRKGHRVGKGSRAGVDGAGDGGAFAAAMDRVHARGGFLGLEGRLDGGEDGGEREDGGDDGDAGSQGVEMGASRAAALDRALAPVTIGDEECSGAWLHSAARRWLVSRGWQVVELQVRDWHRLGPGARQQYIWEVMNRANKGSNGTDSVDPSQGGFMRRMGSSS